MWGVGGVVGCGGGVMIGLEWGRRGGGGRGVREGGVGEGEVRGGGERENWLVSMTITIVY